MPDLLSLGLGSCFPGSQSRGPEAPGFVGIARDEKATADPSAHYARSG